MVVLLDFLAVPFLLVFTIVTSFEDARFGKIRNKWVLAAVLYGFLALLVQVLFLLVTGDQVNLDYLQVFVTNALAAALLGIALWLGHLWTAADAKLFFAYTLAVPLHWYRTSLFSGFPALALLINTVLPLAVFYGGVILWKLLFGPDAMALRKALLEGLRFHRHAELLLFLFGFSWLVSKVLVFILPEAGLLVLIAGMFLFYWVARRLLGVWVLRLSAFMSLLRLVLDAQAVLSPDFLLQFIVMYLFIAVVFVVLLNLSSAAFSEAVPVAGLMVGMIPAEDIALVAHRSEGMSAVEVALLKRLAKLGKLPKKLRICHSVPFAPFMAAGVVLALLLGGNVLLVI